jgi:hypothetical protein
MENSSTGESEPTEADYGHVISNLEDELRRRLEELQRMAPDRRADTLRSLDDLCARLMNARNKIFPIKV